MSEEAATVTPLRPEPLLNISFPSSDEGKVSPTLTVGFLPTPRLAEMVEAQNLKNPYVVWTIRNQSLVRTTDRGSFTEWHDVQHVVTKLDAELVFLTFPRAGDHQIIPIIVDIRTEEFNQQKVRRWEQYPMSHDHQLFWQDGGLRNEAFAMGRQQMPFIVTNIVQTVNVDEELFAREPSRFHQWLVGNFFRERPRTECHNRGRLMVSYAAAAGSLLVWPIRWLMLLVLLTLAIRRVRWWEAFKPFNWRDGWPLSRYSGHSSFWLVDKHGNDRRWIWWLVNPVLLLVIPNLAWLTATQVFGASWNWPFIMASFLGGVALGLVLISLVVFVHGRIQRRRNARPKVAKPKVDRKAQELAKLYTGLSSLAALDTPPTSFDDLPDDKRTIYLRFRNLKAAVCKPFQQQ